MRQAPSSQGYPISDINESNDKEAKLSSEIGLHTFYRIFTKAQMIWTPTQQPVPFNRNVTLTTNIFPGTSLITAISGAPLVAASHLLCSSQYRQTPRGGPQRPAKLENGWDANNIDICLIFMYTVICDYKYKNIYNMQCLKKKETLDTNRCIIIYNSPLLCL